MTAPLESCTVPEIVPLITWANADGMNVLMTADVSRQAKTKGIHNKFDFRIPSCVVVLRLITFPKLPNVTVMSEDASIVAAVRRKPMAVGGITSPYELFQFKRRTGMEQKNLDDSVDFSTSWKICLSTRLSILCRRN